MKTLLLTIALAAALFSTTTQTASAAPEVTVKSYVADSYLAFGNGAKLSDDFALQTDVFALFPSGFYVDLWFSKSFAKTSATNFGNEVDLGFGYSKTWNGWGFDAGVAYFNEPHLSKLGDGDIIYSHVRITHEIFAGVTATAAWENYANMPGTEIDGGNLYGFTFSRNFKVTEKLTFCASAGVAYDDGGYGFEAGIFFRGNAGFEWKVNDSVTLLPISANWYIPTEKNSCDSDAMLMSGIVVKF
jgi:hypothetical protein